MRRSSGSPAAAVLGASVSSSNLSMGPRKVRLSDRELLQRVQRIAVPNAPVNLRVLSPKRGWKRVRTGTAGMDVQYRSLRPAAAAATQCQVVVGGEIRAKTTELLSLLRAPTESESNALLRALFGSKFIYSSLLHAMPGSERGGSLPSPPLRSSGALCGQQVMVRTASFAHTGLFNPFKQRSSMSAPSDSIATSDSHSSSAQQHSTAKNEQCCYVEMLSPMQEGFKMAFCSLDAADVTAGKAPADRVIAVHPISGWLVAVPSPHNADALRLTFQAAFPGQQPGGCSAQEALARMIFFAKGVCRLEKVLRRRRQRRREHGMLWRALASPFRAFSSEEDSGGTHHNWNCIACTRSFLPLLHKRWRRCDLCAYRVCADPPCCSQERVAIYNRYVAPLLVCARCRECIDERDGDHRGSGNPHAGSVGDMRYTGVSLRFADRESELEPELELDPSMRSHGRWGARRSEAQPKRRTQSDPPPILGLAFSSSGEDNSSSGSELKPSAHPKH